MDSSDRKRMIASLTRITETIKKADGMIPGSTGWMITDTRYLFEDFQFTRRKIESLVAEMKKVEEDYYAFHTDHVSSTCLSKSKIIGLCDQRRSIKDGIFLHAKSDEINILVITGMAGVGKTTLVCEAYEDLDVSEVFDFRVWATAGKEWKYEEISKTILAQVLDPEAYNMIVDGSEEEINQKLKNCLEGKRYLIVLDDVWKSPYLEYLISETDNDCLESETGNDCLERETGNDCLERETGNDSLECLERETDNDCLESEISYDLLESDNEINYPWPWLEYLESVFPENENGGLILITSRVMGAAHQVSKYPYLNLRLLDKKESWDLLCEQVFGGDSCPARLKRYGEIIAEKCDGLPLTIITVAQLLSKEKENESLWIDVATKKKHWLFMDAYDQISKVLYPSYEVLSDKYKLCLLYVGAFPLKFEISKSSLFNLWISEKFVEQNWDETLESRAISIFKDLWNDNLVMVYKKSSIGGSSIRRVQVKKCGLHSSWWHFCQIEARRTNCFLVLDSYDEDNIETILENQSRLSIRSHALFAIKHVHNSIEKICALTARSLLCFGPYSQYMVPVCFGLKYLHRLDALNIRFYDFPLAVINLVRLRYLALTCNGNVPPSISNLRKLQYLIVHPHISIKLCGALYSLPTEIWDMKRLKHVEVMGYDLPNLGETSLEELTTLSNVTTRSCTILERAPNLIKLGIEIELAPDASDPLPLFDHVSHLSKLEAFKCVIVNPGRKFKIANEFPILPSTLINLSLSGLQYPWDNMGNISSLPNLKTLKLKCNAFSGRKWKVGKNGFRRLKCLLMEDLDLAKISWADGSFKRLEIVNIKHCYSLKEMGSCFDTSVREFEVVDCNPLVEWHVKKHALIFVGNVTDVNISSSWKHE